MKTILEFSEEEQHEVTPEGKIIFKHDGLQN